MNSALNTAIQETTSGILISLAAAKSEVTVEQLRGDLSVRFGSGGNIVVLDGACL